MEELIGLRGCWINFRLHEGALLLAKFYIRNEGWKVRSIDEHRWYELTDVPIAGRKYFKEAKKNSASLFEFRQKL
jgi:hypothetical protein